MLRTAGMWSLVLLTLAGCGGNAASSRSAPASKVPALTDAEIRAAEFAKMEPVERAVAEAQGYCVVSDEPLGSMGVPYKVSLEGDQSVYVCCKGCEDMVKEKPTEMLARAEELRAKVAKEKGATTESPSAETPAPVKPAAG